MGTKYSASRVRTPDGTLTPPTTPVVDIPLGTLMKPMSEAHPAVDATNGPLTADTQITAGSPSTAGRTLYRWDSGKFRTQGMNWVAAGPANTSGQSAAINASTSRKWTYGTSQGQPVESNHDFAFITDSLTVTVWYWHWTGYTGSNYHDMRMFAEHEGRLKHLRNGSGLTMPSTSTGGGGFFYRTLTFKEARQREIRAMLPSNCFVVGVYVDTTATIRKAANTLLYLGNGDSWQEPNGNILASPIGGAYPTGTYRTMGLVQEFCVATGWVCAQIAQGGTGEFNCNDNGARDQTYTNAVGESVFGGDARINDAWTKFGAGAPLVINIGGWNDGDLTGAPFQANYRTRVAAGIAKWRAKGAKVIGISIQPVGSATTLDANRAASLAGQKEAYLAGMADGTVRGFVDLTPMWPDVSTSGQRGANVNSADTIHLHSKGADGTARWMANEVKPMTIPQSYYNQMLAAA